MDRNAGWRRDDTLERELQASPNTSVMLLTLAVIAAGGVFGAHWFARDAAAEAKGVSTATVAGPGSAIDDARPYTAHGTAGSIAPSLHRAAHERATTDAHASNDRVAAPANLPGRDASLDDAAHLGVLAPGGAEDLDAWIAARRTRDTRLDVAALKTRAREGVYVVHGDLARLHVAREIVLVVPIGQHVPNDVAGHAVILDVATGACVGPACRALMR